MRNIRDRPYCYLGKGVCFTVSYAPKKEKKEVYAHEKNPLYKEGR